MNFHQTFTNLFDGRKFKKKRRIYGNIYISLEPLAKRESNDILSKKSLSQMCVYKSTRD